MNNKRNFDDFRIETERLILRPVRIEEADLVLDYYQRNKEFLRRWDPPKPEGFYTNDFWIKKITQMTDELFTDKSCRFYLFDKTETKVFGTVHFANIERGPFQNCRLGYQLDKDLEGKGYMSEAVSAALKFAFNELNLHRIEANYVPDNLRSGKVLERMGFEIHGTAKNYLFVGAEWKDHVLTSLVNPDFIGL